MASAPKAQAVPRTKHRVRMAVPAVTKNINEDEGLDQGDIEGEDTDDADDDADEGDDHVDEGDDDDDDDDDDVDDDDADDDDVDEASLFCKAIRALGAWYVQPSGRQPMSTS